MREGEIMAGLFVPVEDAILITMVTQVVTLALVILILFRLSRMVK